MDNAEIRRKLLEIAPGLLERYGATQFWLFGSRVRGEKRPDSDVDLLVKFDGRRFSLLDFVGLELEIEDHLAIKVDLVDIEALREDFKPRVLPEAIAV
jgi:predicted nucleotidyltransferase